MLRQEELAQRLVPVLGQPVLWQVIELTCLDHLLNPARENVAEERLDLPSEP